MRKFQFLPFAALLAVSVLPAAAQEPANAPPPPQLETLDESEQPAITIRKPDADKNEITERREQGRVKEVKVKSGGSTYYLKPKGAAGGPPDDAHEGNISVPMWVIKEFDVGQKTEAEKKPNPESAPRLEPAKSQ
ncbi:MAG: DUF2782 domain-containing protein [Burkholderiaceae bacterium]|nr:DUF2782 domain-containing protein [Burkholderiaceae bacterium]